MERLLKEADPLDVAPQCYTVLLENDRVRVLDVHLKPGEEVPMHGHPAMILYPLNDAKALFTFPDGSTEDIDVVAEEATWNEPFSHAAKNVGANDLHIVAIELKH